MTTVPPKPAPRGAPPAKKSGAKSATKAKPAYHHGDLRRALLDAAIKLVSERGLPALTLREVARKVGVTHAAPYHHFPTREALLDALAHEAFAALDDATARALVGIDAPGERLFVTGQAYADFAMAHPELLQIMFRRQPAPTAPPDPELLAASARAYAHLHDAVVACQAAALAPPGDPYQVALVAWSVVHGFAKLWVEGPLDSMPPYAGNYEQLRDQTLRSLLAGWSRPP